MKRIEYQPKKREKIILDETVLLISPPKTKIYPYLLDITALSNKLNNYKDKDISELSEEELLDYTSITKKVFKLQRDIIMTTLEYCYPDNTVQELELILEDNITELTTKYFYIFTGMTKEEHDKNIQKVEAENKLSKSDPRIKNL